MAAIDMSKPFLFWNFPVDKGSAKALPRVFSVSAKAAAGSAQLTAKPAAVRPIESGSAAENRLRTRKPADDINGPAA
ncbi:hypothetical protein J7E70_08435 [Variovorax paradoxus]|nr:hypothetical protein [Variovorax paradoxus]MBT2300488.1 hypothetical protein [Variovorax paradoxus]